MVFYKRFGLVCILLVTCIFASHRVESNDEPETTVLPAANENGDSRSGIDQADKDEAKNSADGSDYEHFGWPRVKSSTTAPTSVGPDAEIKPTSGSDQLMDTSASDAEKGHESEPKGLDETNAKATHSEDPTTVESKPRGYFRRCRRRPCPPRPRPRPRPRPPRPRPDPTEDPKPKPKPDPQPEPWSTTTTMPRPRSTRRPPRPTRPPAGSTRSPPPGPTRRPPRPTRLPPGSTRSPPPGSTRAPPTRRTRPPRTTGKPMDSTMPPTPISSSSTTSRINTLADDESEDNTDIHRSSNRCGPGDNRCLKPYPPIITRSPLTTTQRPRPTTEEPEPEPTEGPFQTIIETEDSIDDDPDNYRKSASRCHQSPCPTFTPRSLWIERYPSKTYRPFVFDYPSIRGESYRDDLPRSDDYAVARSPVFTSYRWDPNDVDDSFSTTSSDEDNNGYGHPSFESSPRYYEDLSNNDDDSTRRVRGSDRIFQGLGGLTQGIGRLSRVLSHLEGLMNEIPQGGGDGGAGGDGGMGAMGGLAGMIPGMSGGGGGGGMIPGMSGGGGFPRIPGMGGMGR